MAAAISSAREEGTSEPAVGAALDAESGETVKVVDSEIPLRPVVDDEQESFLKDPNPSADDNVSDQSAPSE